MGHFHWNSTEKTTQRGKKSNNADKICATALITVAQKESSCVTTHETTREHIFVTKQCGTCKRWQHTVFLPFSIVCCFPKYTEQQQQREKSNTMNSGWATHKNKWKCKNNKNNFLSSNYRHVDPVFVYLYSMSFQSHFSWSTGGNFLKTTNFVWKKHTYTHEIIII